MKDGKYFSEKDVGKIVRRAAELQEKSTGPSTYSPGVSREELERVAKEMGIDLPYLDQAVQERLQEASGEGLTVLGVPLSREYERVIPGELPPEDFDVVIEETAFNRKSQFTNQIGRSLQSHLSSGLGYAKMNVHSRDGRTRLRMKSIPLYAGLLTLYPAFLAALISSVHLTETVAHLPGWVVPGIIAAGLSLGWAGFAGLARLSHKAVADLTARIEARIAEATRGRSGQAVGQLEGVPDEESEVRHVKGN
ncbi:MAG: hypothetical protein JST30_10100 [Armatimonadetes bacterium]|nr:hypothetical protein [Armatimonadota bacterium]